MTRSVTGKKGGGKSYFAMRVLRRALLFTQRCIVTNLSIRWKEMEAYYKKHAPEGALPLAHRLKVLSGVEACSFYRHRACVNGSWVVLPDFGKDDEFRYSAKEHGPGVMYIIDEVHIWFSARRWQQSPRAALDYMTLEDKIGDQVFLITQNLGQVDKQFRTLSNEYIEVVNRGRELFFGFFRKPKGFEHTTWYEPPNHLGHGRGPTGAFRLELDGLAECYDSSAGQGVEGLLNDRGESEEPVVGFPWWVAIFVVLGGIWGLMQVPGMLGRAMASATQTMVSVGTSNAFTASVVQTVTGHPPVPAPLSSSAFFPPLSVGSDTFRPLTIQAAGATSGGASSSEPVETRARVTMLSRIGGVTEVMFDTGHRFRGDEIEEVNWKRNAVKIGGEWWN